MATKNGPTLRAQWLGQQLRELREAAGLKLTEVSEYLLQAQSTLSRYETGVVPPRPGDVIALLNIYGVDDKPLRDGLDQLSRDAWHKGWWDGYAGHVSGKFIDYAWLESRARSIRSFDSLVITGIAQTPGYAEATIRAGDPDAPKQQIQRWLDFRMARQKILDADDAPKVSIILDEALLRRPVGGPEAMRAQLDHLGTLVERSGTTIRVLPFAAGAHAAHDGAFQIFDMTEPYPEVAYAETLAGSLYVESHAVSRFIRAYDLLERAALPPDESAALIAKAAKEIV